MEEKRAIALGFFDGVHVGHAQLLRKAAEHAEKLDAIPAALSFDAHPGSTISGNAVPLINSPFERADIMRRHFGISDLIFLHFDEKLMKMEWDKFVEWLVTDFGAVYLVAGFDFRFGYGGKGTAEKLKEKCGQMGIECDIVEPVTVDGIPASSTHIRGLLEKGDVETANKFLGHRHFFVDRVRYGYRLGRKLGMPTVNMRFDEGVLVPKHGVYASAVYLLETGERYDAVTNIGVRPTVGGVDKVSVETHLLGYSGNLYGQRLRVEFYKFLRPEIKFGSTEELARQTRKDADAAKEFFKEYRC